MLTNVYTFKIDYLKRKNMECVSKTQSIPFSLCTACCCHSSVLDYRGDTKQDLINIVPCINQSYQIDCWQNRKTTIVNNFSDTKCYQCHGKSKALTAKQNCKKGPKTSSENYWFYVFNRSR